MIKIDYDRLYSAANRTPEIYPPANKGSVAAAPLITMINKLFGSVGPLASYKLVAIIPNEPGKSPHFTLDVEGAWRPGVARAIEATVARAISENQHLDGWVVAVTDNSNLELPMQSPRT